jgi:hypothetical protein
MSHSYDDMVNAAYHGKSAEEILAASPAALHGVSEDDAARLADAFGIRSVRQLAENRFFRRARAVMAGAGVPAFDPGPPPEWEAFFAGAPLAVYRQYPQDFRLEFGPVYYRGRLDDTARVIVVGQDPSVNEILGHRIFVGRSGQRVQGFLRKLGLTRSYAMLNTFLYSVYGQFGGTLEALSRNGPVLDYRNAFLDRLAGRNPVRAVVAVGRGAADAVRCWPRHGDYPVVHITHPAAHDEQALPANWNAGLATLRPLVEADDDGRADPAPYGAAFTDADRVPIPRHDLPFGVPDWHGVGSHARRGDPKTIIWTSP